MNGPVRQQGGDEWVRPGASLVLRVPSVVVPQEHNDLIDPQRPDVEDLERGRGADHKKGSADCPATAPSSSSKTKKRQFGSVEGEIWMSEDFDEPLDDFDAYDVEMLW